MSRRALEAVIGRVILDEEFRWALFADPEVALVAYELTEDEMAALRSVDAESLDAFAEGPSSQLVGCWKLSKAMSEEGDL